MLLVLGFLDEGIISFPELPVVFVMPPLYFLLPVPLAWAGNQISCCVSVYVCRDAYGRIVRPIFTKFGKNLLRPKSKNCLGWVKMRKCLPLF